MHHLDFWPRDKWVISALMRRCHPLLWLRTAYWMNAWEGNISTPTRLIIWHFSLYQSSHSTPLHTDTKSFKNMTNSLKKYVIVVNKIKLENSVNKTKIYFWRENSNNFIWIFAPKLNFLGANRLKKLVIPLRSRIIWQIFIKCKIFASLCSKLFWPFLHTYSSSSLKCTFLKKSLAY